MLGELWKLMTLWRRLAISCRLCRMADGTDLSNVRNIDWLTGPLLLDPANQPVHYVYNVVVVVPAQWPKD